MRLPSGVFSPFPKNFPKSVLRIWRSHASESVRETQRRERCQTVREKDEVHRTRPSEPGTLITEQFALPVVLGSDKALDRYGTSPSLETPLRPSNPTEKHDTSDAAPHGLGHAGAAFLCAGRVAEKWTEPINAHLTNKRFDSPPRLGDNSTKQRGKEQ